MWQILMPLPRSELCTTIRMPRETKCQWEHWSNSWFIKLDVWVVLCVSLKREYPRKRRTTGKDFRRNIREVQQFRSKLLSTIMYLCTYRREHTYILYVCMYVHTYVHIYVHVEQNNAEWNFPCIFRQFGINAL